MTGAAVLLAGALSALLSVALIGLLRHVAARRRWLDVPTPRSSHAVPTPRGAGLGFMFPILLGLAVAPAWGADPGVAWPAAAALGSLVVVGWWDDFADLGIAPRLVVHVVVGLVVAFVGIRLGLVRSDGALGWIQIAGCVAWTVASINVINFMDGIDGLVGLQAVVFAAFVAVATVGSGLVEIFAVIVAGALGGFLVHNWPPATIFMGDAGSGALGATIVLLGLLSIDARGWSPFHAWLPLVPLFLDEALTMARRLARGEAIWRPHRSHVYQLLVQSGWTHAAVTLAFAGAALAGCAVSLSLPELAPPFLLTALLFMSCTAVGLLLLGHRARRVPRSGP